MSISVYIQLVDDLLDFVSSEQIMGKPTVADLKLGLATAPVLFAAQEVGVLVVQDLYYIKVQALYYIKVQALYYIKAQGLYNIKVQALYYIKAQGLYNIKVQALYYIKAHQCFFCGWNTYLYNCIGRIKLLSNIH
jgi:hypothetical protein